MAESTWTEDEYRDYLEEERRLFAWTLQNLKVDLIILLAKNDYPPVDRDEVYKEIFEQAENFKKYRAA